MAARRRSAWSERRKCGRSLCVFFGSQADFIYAQNTRYEDLTPRQRENFVELTGKAGNL